MKIPRQLIGLCWLAILAGGLIGVVVLYAHFSGRHDARVAELSMERQRQDSLARALELQYTLRQQQKAEWDSLRLVRQRRKAEYEKQRAIWEQEKQERLQRRYDEEHIPVVLQPFDPNTADSTTLVHLGLRPWMARGVVRYRLAGGVFRKPADVRRIYGMTDSLFQVLEPYITLPEQAEVVLQRKADTVLSINAADTTQLKLIRGIGSYTARQIVRFRDQIGGFYSLQQLYEVPYIRGVDSLIPHFFIDSALIKPLYINKLNIRQLTRHRYLSFEQAEAIMQIRKKHIVVKAEDELLKTALFTEEDLRRLRPYLRYDN